MHYTVLRMTVVGGHGQAIRSYHLWLSVIYNGLSCVYTMTIHGYIMCGLNVQWIFIMVKTH